jgi:hypothetical protein
MSFYQQEQIDALQMVLEHLQSLSEEDQVALADLIAEYLSQSLTMEVCSHNNDRITLASAIRRQAILRLKSIIILA